MLLQSKREAKGGEILVAGLSLESKSLQEESQREQRYVLPPDTSQRHSDNPKCCYRYCRRRCSLQQRCHKWEGKVRDRERKPGEVSSEGSAGSSNMTSDR
jgi:hypothetical protein